VLLQSFFFDPVLFTIKLLLGLTEGIPEPVQNYADPVHIIQDPNLTF